MKTAYHATLASTQSINGSAVLPFASILKPCDSLETLSGGVGVKALRSGPLSFNVSLYAQGGALMTVNLFKNGNAFKTLAVDQNAVCVTASDPTALKGDEYGVQVGGDEILISAEPLYASLSITD